MKISKDQQIKTLKQEIKTLKQEIKVLETVVKASVKLSNLVQKELDQLKFETTDFDYAKGC